jgi:hypothetical protein
MIKPEIYGLTRAASAIRVLDQRTGSLSAWRLYPHQVSALKELIKHDRSIWLKARQMGISTLMVYYVLMLGVLNANIRVAVVADNFQNSMGLLEKIRDFCRQLGIELQTDNQKRLVLTNGSSFDAITVNTSLAGDSTAGRSRTFHVLLLSEAAYYNNSHAVFASLTSSAIPDAIIIVESTATPGQTMFRSLWDGSSYHKRFLSMEDHANYSRHPEELTDEQWSALQARYGFVKRSAASFWVHKLQNEFGGEVNRLLREYPILEQHSWSTASGRFIDTDPAVRAEISTMSKTRIFATPGHGGHFIFGVDVSAGVGRDVSSIVVWDLVQRQIAAIYASADDKLPEIGAELKFLHSYYKPHAIYVEGNGIGGAFVPELQRLGLPVIELTTTEASKYAGMLRVKIAVEKDGVCADEAFAGEAAGLTYHMVGTRERFSHTDRLMSLSFCLLREPDYEYILKTPAPRPPVPDGHWDMQRVLDRETKRRRKERRG